MSSKFPSYSLQTETTSFSYYKILKVMNLEAPYMNVIGSYVSQFSIERFVYIVGWAVTHNEG